MNRFRLLAVLVSLLAGGLISVAHAETDWITAPDGILEVGDFVKYIGDPSTCTPPQLPDTTGGCGFIEDCQRFQICTSCSNFSCFVAMYIFGAEFASWVGTGRVGSIWKVISIEDNAADSDWDCIELSRCE